MTSGLAALVLPWVTTAAVLLALASAITVLAARSLFGVAAGVAALSACAAASFAALGYSEGALGFALFGVGLAPVLFLGGVLLSGRAARPRKRGAPWLTIAAAGAAAAAMLWVAPTIAGDELVAPIRGVAPLGLGALVFVAVAACAALLGYGERGVLGNGRDA